jgi:hypothetical protein
MKIIDWIKNNKLSAFLILVILFFFWPRILGIVLSPFSRSTRQAKVSTFADPLGAPAGFGADLALEGISRGGYTPSYQPVAPQPDVEDRKMITSSYLSLLVTDVTQSIERIKLKVKDVRGYVVNENINRNPEFGDEEATIVVRIPTDTVDQFKAYTREIAVKVVSETIRGDDITDEYIDLEERISRLERTKTRFEQILDSAETVEEILKVQREIFNLQDQIDNYKGRLQYMEGASSTSLITLNLSTDELGLPYAPLEKWRPQVVFKKAVRSMLGTLQDLGTLLIWLAVYIPVIAIIVIAYKLVRRFVFKKKEEQTQS